MELEGKRDRDIEAASSSQVAKDERCDSAILKAREAKRRKIEDNVGGAAKIVAGRPLRTKKHANLYSYQKSEYPHRVGFTVSCHNANKALMAATKMLSHFIDHSDWGARQSNTIENPESGDPASATSGEAAKPEKLKYFDIIDSGVKCMFIVAYTDQMRRQLQPPLPTLLMKCIGERIIELRERMSDVEEADAPLSEATLSDRSLLRKIKTWSQYFQRITPIDAFCVSELPLLAEKIGVLQSNFLRAIPSAEKRKLSLVIERRNNKKIAREDIQKTVFSVIDESRFTVNYKEPEVILLVVLIKSAFAVSLSNNYLLHRKYNLELLIRDGSPVPSIVSAAAADADKAVDDKSEEDEARA